MHRQLRTFAAILFVSFLSVSFIVFYSGIIPFHHQFSNTTTSPIRRADQETQKPSEIIEKTINSEKSEGFCNLPVLDPYHVDVKKYIEKLERPTCSGQKFGRFVNGKFFLKVKNVRDVTIRLIRRPHEDDFYVDSSKTITLLKHPKIWLESGRYGCLGVKLSVKHILMANNVDNSGNQAVLKPKECSYEGIMYFSTSGKIWDVLHKQCLHVRGKELYFEKCSSASSKFRFDNDGRIWYVDSRFFGLWSRSYCLVAERNGKQWRLKLNKKCRSSRNKNIFYILEAELQDVNMKLRIDEEAFQLYMIKDNHLHTELHLHTPRRLPRTMPVSKQSSIPLDIILLMFDSQSNANFQRAMPKTLKTLQSFKHSFHFQGHAIVGDGTTAQLCAMLTGIAEENLPEARRNYENADFVDRWPFIFNVLKTYGYVTMFTDDQPSSASFNMRLHGFKNQPTDHYSRPFWMFAEGQHSTDYCILDRFSHEYNFEYLKDFSRTYRDTRKFSLTITSDICHNSVNPIQFVDKDLSELIIDLEKEGHLNHSMLVIFGDHGNRVSEFRDTLQGKLEERLPYFSLTLPEWFGVQYPMYVQNLQENTQTLTSHFDVYHTMMDLLGIYEDAEDKRVGQSLFRIIDNKTRTCASAGIDDHWCPCLVYSPVSVDSSNVIKVATEAVAFINSLIFSSEKGKELCEKLELRRVLKAGHKEPSDKVQRFANTKKNSKCDSCDIEYQEEKTHSSSVDYEILIQVKPSNGKFEINARVTDGIIKIHPSISRVNRYGHQPACIEHTHPHLRKYCFCKYQTKEVN